MIFFLQKDYLFKSPSIAGGVTLGMRVNGWSCWKNKDGKTLDEIYRKNLDEK